MVRRCRRIRYMAHVISDHVSFGSQLQYVPQALLAQIDQVIMPRVKRGQPNVSALYPSVSMMSNDGRR